MRKIILSCLILGTLSALQSCSEDFEVSAPYKQMTVVYGMLDMKDTAQYIRIQKAFLDESKNAFDMAKVSDSNFYKEGDLEVLVQEMNGGSPSGQPILLQRVDMEAEGYIKDSGTFFRSKNYAYKFAKPLNPNRTYKLIVNNKINGAQNTAEINIIDSSKLKLRGNVQNRAVNFAVTDPKLSGTKLAFFLDEVGHARYIEAALRFRWVNKVLTTGSQTHDSADFVFARLNGDDVESGELTASNSTFWAFLLDAMGAAPEGVARYMDSVDIIIYGAGKEYSNYVTTVQIQSSGLTQDQIKPLFTNISGKDVFGIFSSKSSRITKNAYLHDNTIDSLKQSKTTRHLNIQGRADP